MQNDWDHLLSAKVQAITQSFSFNYHTNDGFVGKGSVRMAVGLWNLLKLWCYLKVNTIWNWTPIFLFYICHLWVVNEGKNDECTLWSVRNYSAANNSWSLAKQNLIMSDQSLTMVFFSDVHSRSFVLLP